MKDWKVLHSGPEALRPIGTDSDTWKKVEEERVGARPRPSAFERISKSGQGELMAAHLQSLYGQDGFPSQILRERIAQRAIEGDQIQLKRSERQLFGRPATNRFLLAAPVVVWIGHLADDFLQSPPRHIIGSDSHKYNAFLARLSFLEKIGKRYYDEIKKIHNPKKRIEDINWGGVITLIYLELDLAIQSVGVFFERCPENLWPRVNEKPVAPQDWSPTSETVPDFDKMQDYWRKMYKQEFGERMPSCGELLTLAQITLLESRSLVDAKTLRDWEKRLDYFGPLTRLSHP